MAVVMIPKKITQGAELVIIPRQEYERFLKLIATPEKVEMADILSWSREAKKLKTMGKLSLLRSLKDLR